MTTQDPDQGQDTRSGTFHHFTGLLVTGIGCFWLAKQVGWIPATAGGEELVWPLLLMALGLRELVRRRGNRYQSTTTRSHHDAERERRQV
ncbi:MAG: hypothetical protein D6736_14095 [Nitrospinota bacterium]|nr:MAG: hypothetical protein D6736_14095 [Nitrospinota bacterium]